MIQLFTLIPLIQLFGLALVYVVTLSSHGPYPPVHADHDPGVEIARLPFEASERIFARPQQDVVFALDSVDGIETVDVSLDIPGRKPGDEQGTLGRQDLLQSLFPLDLGLYDLAAILVDGATSS